jgi:hypothetical protein
MKMEVFGIKTVSEVWVRSSDCDMYTREEIKWTIYTSVHTGIFKTTTKTSSVI